MKRSEVLKEISKLLSGLPDNMSSYEKAEEILEVIEEYMEPKVAGDHQSSFDLAMGARCQWSKE
jgi:hypothetical protein